MKKIITLFVVGLVVVSFVIDAEIAAAADDYKTFIRLHPMGPPGVGMKGDETEKEHVYHSSAANELISAGVWQHAPYTEGPATPNYSEFMLYLDGSVTLIDSEGREDTFKAGEASLVPRGVEYTWKQTEPIRKYWVIFDVVETKEAKRPKSYIRFDPNVELKGEGGRTKEHMYYAANEEKISAGVWEAQPQTSPPSDYHTPNYTELMYILEGSVTLEDKAGREDTFKAGDAVIVPRGVAYKWKQSEYIKKYWVIYDVDPSSATDEP